MNYIFLAFYKHYSLPPGPTYSSTLELNGLFDQTLSGKSHHEQNQNARKSLNRIAVEDW